MEREETNSSHLCTSRTALWCPICGAPEGKGCTPVKGLRFAGHNLYATGYLRPEIPAAWEPLVARKDAPHAKWSVKGWVN